MLKYLKATFQHFNMSDLIFIVGIFNYFTEGRATIGMMMMCTSLLMDKIDKLKDKSVITSTITVKGEKNAVTSS